MIVQRSLPSPAAGLLACLLGLLATAACAGETPEAPVAASPSPTAPVETSGVQPLEPLEVERVFPSLSFARMTYLTHAGDGSGRVFVTLQPGVVMVFADDPDPASAGIFLGIRDRVSDRGNEEGLLGLAFDPGHSENGYLYVYYSAADPRRSVLSRFFRPAGFRRSGPCERAGAAGDTPALQQP